ncbi:MAG: HD family phosphohydrolase, partial [Vulcanococcus sp.]
MTRPGPGHPSLRQPIQQPLRILQRLWRRLLRLESPRQALSRWRNRDTIAVLVGCLLVALVSSWPWLVEPSLRPGIPAPFTVRAPKAATVVDSDALEQRRSQLGPRSHVQVVDPRINHDLEQRLERQLQAITRLSGSAQDRVPPLDLKPPERQWLETVSAAELVHW